MKACVSTLSFRSCGLEEAAGIIRALGFDAMDVDGALDTTLKREAILSVDRSEVSRLRAFEMTVPNIHWTFGKASLMPAINDPDPAVRARHKDMFLRLVEFCHEAGILSILVLPGVFYPGQTAAEARALAASALTEFLPIAQEAGVTLGIEGHVGSIFGSPESILALIEQVPGLGVVHDYAHFVCQGYPQSAADALCAHTIHVHLRQAKSGLLQTPLEDGTINFALVLDQLRGAGYDRYLCIEYVHQDYIGADNVDIVTETVKMRDFLKAHLNADRNE
jgi:sugar phosphate isomerase/epimerase